MQLIFLLIIMNLAYTSYKLFYLKKLLILFLIFLFVSLYLYFIKNTLILNLFYLFIISINFLILHFKQRVSLIFYFLFYSTIFLVVYLGNNYPSINFVTNLIITLIFFLTENNQHLLKESYEQSANEYQNKILEKQVAEVQNVYLTMRGWRHDYHNHLQTLKAHLNLNNFDLARNYLNELEKDLNQVNHLIESGNVNLDAILNSKLSLAQSREIDINFKAVVPEILTLSDIDLCVLIGNLIDNAMEACDKIEDNKPKFIRLYIRILKQQLYISITNTTNETIKKLDDEYITNKRGNHGHGLKRINLIVDKYQGYINRKNEPGAFVTEILIPLN